jgi:histone H3/H4
VVAARTVENLAPRHQVTRHLLIPQLKRIANRHGVRLLDQGSCAVICMDEMDNLADAVMERATALMELSGRKTIMVRDIAYALKAVENR